MRPTKLHQALYALLDRGDSRSVKTLLSTGAIGVDDRFDDGMTLLIALVTPDMDGDQTTATAILAAARFLVQEGADRSLTDSAGRTAADHARLLIDPDWRDVYGHAHSDSWIAASRDEVEDILRLLEPSRKPA